MRGSSPRMTKLCLLWLAGVALRLTLLAVPPIIPKWLTGVVPTGHQYGTSYWAQVWGAS